MCHYTDKTIVIVIVITFIFFLIYVNLKFEILTVEAKN